jgi:hypothetical protein
MLKEVFPMAVGPRIVIRCFIIYCAEIETKTPDDCKLLFLDVKEPLWTLLLCLRNTITKGAQVDR